MSSHLHLLKLTIRPYAYTSDVISGCCRILKEATSTSTSHIVHSYKLDGENKLLFVIDGSVDELMGEVWSSYGEQIESSCVPLRHYESFAEHVLGVEKVVGGNAWNPDGRLYWVVFDVEYQGKELSEFLEIWKQEAEAAIGMVKAGKMVVYKTLAKRQVHCFVTMDNSDLLDDVLFTLPIIKVVGNQVHTTAYSILPV